MQRLRAILKRLLKGSRLRDRMNLKVKTGTNIFHQMYRPDIRDLGLTRNYFDAHVLITSLNFSF